MKYPGVVENRDLLLRYQSRGVMLRNTVTSRNERLNDWMAVRDLSRARDVLRQNAYELTAVGGEEKKALIAWLDSWIRPNVRYSEAETRALEQAALQQVDPVVVQVKKGRTIVRTGDEITSQTLAALKALMGLKQPHRLLGKILGIFALVAFFLLVLWKYLVTGPGLHEKARAQYVLLTTVLLIGLLVARLFVGLADTVADRLLPESFQNPSHFYLVSPWAFGAILVVLLTSGQTAVLFSLMFSVFSGLLTGQVSMTAYSLTGCMVASYLLDHYRERLAIVRAGVGIGLASVIAAVSLQFYTSAPTFSWEVLLVRVVGAFFSGLFAAMLASILLPILESWFEITTDIRLLELSNLNKPVLRRLAVEAPGTYHHSIVVGTLGEAAAEAISANPLLVRVGAYYHDIGKLKKPGYYVENQIYCSNKHENLAPSMSSLVLASHVKDGLAIADEIGLAPRVRDMIPQHHGTRVMTYFYQKAKEEAEEKRHTVSEDDYRYPGPKPQSKEAAILMLADQVEAASRTLQDPNPGQIQGMIRRLIQATIQDGQLEECDITMRELEVLAQAFERVLAGMYHHRIEYPGFTFNVPLEEKRPESQRIQ
jgi:putative nucleotidyltransferase with HDIG domain